MSEDTATNHSAKVTVYSTSWCAFCHTEMEWLEKLGIDFIKKDIEAEPAAKEELLAMTKENWSNLTIEQYQKLFKGSAVKRAKYSGLMRNIKTIEQYEQCRNEERTP